MVVIRSAITRAYRVRLVTKSLEGPSFSVSRKIVGERAEFSSCREQVGLSMTRRNTLFHRSGITLFFLAACRKAVPAFATARVSRY